MLSRSMVYPVTFEPPRISPKPQLRLALFTGSYQYIRDGVALTLNRWVNYLLSQNISVMIFSPTAKHPALHTTGQLISAPSIALPGRSEYRMGIGFSSSMKRELAQFDPNLIHIATPDLLGIRALEYAKAQDIPMVMSYHTHFTAYLKYYRLNMFEASAWKYLTWFYGQARRVYVPTQSMAETLVDRSLSDKIEIWPRGVDSDLFRPEIRDNAWRRQIGIKDDEIAVLFVSRLVAEKNLKLLGQILTLAMQMNRRIRPVIVGEGPARKELQNTLPSAIFLGQQNGNDLAKVYACCDVFLFPSETETFGNVTLEALAAGLPVIAADATGSRSLITNEHNGFLAEPLDVTDFAAKLNLISENRQLRKRMSAQARQTALLRPWSQIHQSLLQSYYDVLAEGFRDEAAA
ncbi:glycosyltransferase family 1 protein [bacterium]|nr:glycosyltransferase family 1 protein [bacterium]